MNFASVVSCDTVLLHLVIAAVNNLEVKCGDVMNSYITAPIEENIWTTLEPNFGTGAGKISLVVYALYGIKSAGAAFRAYVGWCMEGLGYEPYLADPDL